MTTFRSSVITHGFWGFVKIHSTGNFCKFSRNQLYGIHWVEKLMESIKPLQSPWITGGFENEQVFARTVV